MTPVTKRRIQQFKANKRGYISLWIFLGLFLLCMCADFIANDKPLLIRYDGSFYAPVFKSYAETTFGGDFETEAEYRDPFVQELITEKGWMVWAPIRFSYDTINYNLPQPAPSPPTRWGTRSARPISPSLRSGRRTPGERSSPFRRKSSNI